MSLPSVPAFILHLNEIRRRLWWTLGVFLIATLIIYPYSHNIFCFLSQPLMQVVPTLIYTGVGEAFVTYVQLSILMGALVTLPFLLVQIWLFVLPGLYLPERKSITLILISFFLLFLAGVVFALLVVLPQAIKILVKLNTPGLNFYPRVGEYFKFVTTLGMVFGVAFQLPLVCITLAKARIITATNMQKYTRLVVVTIFAAAAIITPPDAISMLLLALPLTVLYMASVVLIRYKFRISSK